MEAGDRLGVLEGLEEERPQHRFSPPDVDGDQGRQAALQEHDDEEKGDERGHRGHDEQDERVG
jgi:hypothetical protein